ncbi:sulfur oxidation c-type cytochrome SoxA [Noviherbaspirillum cavernae]|uniref:SoxAX cytochrome complex subunit A n=1 Tax=Noviherbaspirillum cavernae TaxID=2320862 RepID=A0A418WZR5_9BURK|nr:sulfur oxidation c-type cytochrome SoxA [Noviherbaspirillum cavernae]RJG05692.1 sulfur oxidation c-type cytochrome SoxA [Noviherbaspirillum cavernae]
MRRKGLFIFMAAALGAAAPAMAQTSTTDEIAKYRQLLADGNPAELWEMRGEELWKTATGPKKVSLEQCDLGKGPGVVKGAYVELPRYFKDVNKVMDLEQRLMHCRMSLQGLTREQATKTPFGSAGNPSDIEALVSYITAESRGMKMSVSTAHPQEKRAYEIGQKIFFHRGGAHDFACATCHSVDGQRIRLQELPNILNKTNAQAAYTTWPAYRVSQGEVRTMQHRLYDCFRQQRFPEPAYASDVITAVTMFLAKNADGGVYNAPALKR